MPRTSAAALVAVLAVLALTCPPRLLEPTGEGAVPTAGHQRAARASGPARPVRQADPDATAGRLASWVPEHPLARPHVVLLRGLAGAAGPVDPADAAELLAALASHAVWLAGEGTEVDQDALLDPDLVRRWSVVGLVGLSAGTAANYRSRLARVAAAVQPGRRHTVLGASGPVAVYSPAEEDALLSWGDALRTSAMRRDVLVLLCLGLGAGLTTSETTAARGGGIVQHDAGMVTVTVEGRRPRLVPLRARYGPLLAALAAGAGTGSLFRPDAEGRGGRNGVSNLVARARRGCDSRLPVLSPQRMRATWLVRHLDAGVRADALLKAAGLDSLAVLDRYLPAVRPLTTAQVLAELTRTAS